MRIIQIGALVSALLLSACESTAVEDNMGKAVAQMKHDQVSNPATSIGPNDAPVEGMDPESANNALENMRKDQPSREAVRRDILINIGAKQGSGNQ
jgi:hypothetical protein